MVKVLRQKQIVIVPFPFSDQSGEKKRPALIVSNDGFNEKSDDVIACAITSDISEDAYSVQIKPGDWKDGMYSESCVKTASIFSLDKDIVLRPIGRLSGERFREVMGKIQEIIK